MPADARVDEIDAAASISRAKLTISFHVPPPSTKSSTERREDDDKTLPDRCTDAADRFDRETEAIFCRAAPAILALIGAPRDELVDQVALRAPWTSTPS